MTGRTLAWITVKRNNTGFRDTYGHWWLEVDGRESYAWWAVRCPLRLRDVLFGTRGVLNGVGIPLLGGTVTTDPRHGETPDHAFHPWLTDGRRDDEVRHAIHLFARSYGGRWGWQWWWCRQRMTNCHTFQDDLFATVGLVEPREFRYTRGAGCPFLYPLRRLSWKVSDGFDAARRRARAWITPTPRPGSRGAEL